MKLQRVSVVGLLVMFGVALTLSAVHGQRGTDTAKDPVAEADDEIIAEIHDHNEIMSNLEYLSDMIGQRLTGSANLKKANDWTKERFTAYGAENSHLESWQIARTWTRGTARGRIVSPAEHPLSLASYGWAPGTNGVLRGPIVYVKAQSIEELQAYKGKLKNAFVIM